MADDTILSNLPALTFVSIIHAENQEIKSDYFKFHSVFHTKPHTVEKMLPEFIQKFIFALQCPTIKK